MPNIRAQHNETAYEYDGTTAEDVARRDDYEIRISKRNDGGTGLMSSQSSPRGVSSPPSGSAHELLPEEKPIGGSCSTQPHIWASEVQWIGS